MEELGAQPHVSKPSFRLGCFCLICRKTKDGFESGGEGGGYTATFGEISLAYDHRSRVEWKLGWEPLVGQYLPEQFGSRGMEMRRTGS